MRHGYDNLTAICFQVRIGAPFLENQHSVSDKAMIWPGAHNYPKKIYFYHGNAVERRIFGLMCVRSIEWRKTESESEAGLDM